MMSAVEGEETPVTVENGEGEKTAEDNLNEVPAEKQVAEKQVEEEGSGGENRKVLEKPPIAVCPMPEEEKDCCCVLL